MIDKVNCELIDMIIKVISSYKELEPPFILAIAMMAMKGYGRVMMSRISGLRERAVRNALSYIRSIHSDIHDLITSLLNNRRRVEASTMPLTCEPVLYTGFDDLIMKAVKSQVVKLRDFIVVNSRDPYKIEVIGVVENGTITIPGLPEELQSLYCKINDLVPRDSNGIIVCWRRYREFIDDSSLLLSLGELCRSLSR